ncbi:H-NS histone family protein [Paraburkholderia mimosarum]|uniref:H-NS histone family protein n=1 Tax=Paraburkholderia mimosarum TaxID=312026 RepID=UPI000413CFB4|nr:H-NS histone family protein [Paraburkholderia mimosarum]
MKLPELKAQLADLNAKIEAARAAELAEAIAACREIIETYDLTAHDLGLIKTQVIGPRRGRPPRGTFVPKAPRTVNPPLYRDPKSGATWTGRGRAPQWLEGERDAYVIR